MMDCIDQHKYTTPDDFMADIELIRKNALEYNPVKTNEGTYAYGKGLI